MKNKRQRKDLVNNTVKQGNTYDISNYFHKINKNRYNIFSKNIQNDLEEYTLKRKTISKILGEVVYLYISKSGNKKYDIYYLDGRHKSLIVYDKYGETIEKYIYD